MLHIQYSSHTKSSSIILGCRNPVRVMARKRIPALVREGIWRDIWRPITVGVRYAVRLNIGRASQEHVLHRKEIANA